MKKTIASLQGFPTAILPCPILPRFVRSSFPFSIPSDACHASYAELPVITSYPSSVSGLIIVLLDTPTKYKKIRLKQNKNAPKITTDAYHICRAWYNGS